MLNSLNNLASTGVGVSALAAIAELQGLNITLLAGKGAGVKNDLAAIRPEDTIVAALNNATGTITDVTGTTTIIDTRASGTLTLTGVLAADTVTVQGQVYTAVAGVAANNTQFSIAGNDTADAAALAAAINSRQNSKDVSLVLATPATNVVTVRAVAEGVAANAYTLVGNARAVASGAVLAGGTVTGGVATVGVTNQVILFWFNKK